MPDDFFGSCLIFPKPPKACDFLLWTSRFKPLFADRADIPHQTFLWPSYHFDASGILPFTKAGFELDATAVMTGAQSQARRSLRAGLVLRQVTSNVDRRAASDL